MRQPFDDEMRHGLFPKDDISEKDSTEFRRDLIDIVLRE
jgi:hypothetical protein